MNIFFLMAPRRQAIDWFSSEYFINLIHQRKIISMTNGKFVLVPVKQPKAMEASKDVYVVLKPLFIILKIFGLASYRLDAESKKLKTTITDWILFFASLCLWCGMIWMQAFRKMNNTYVSGIDSPILDSLWRYQFVFQHFSGLTIVIFNFYHRQSVVKFLKIISDFDEKIKNLKLINVHSSKIFKRYVIAFLIGLVLLLCYGAAFSINNNLRTHSLDAYTLTYNLFNFYFILIFYVLLSLQFIITVYCVRSRLTKIIENLRWLFRRISQ